MFFRLAEPYSFSVSAVVGILISVGDEKAGAKRAPSQANSNTFYGWKGNARNSWYDDGTWDYHKTAGDDWTKISGSYNMTGKK